jgi:hypothetical protein
MKSTNYEIRHHDNYLYTRNSSLTYVPPLPVSKHHKSAYALPVASYLYMPAVQT